MIKEQIKESMTSRKAKANMMLADQRKILVDIIEEKEFIDPNRLSLENLKNYNEAKEESAILDKVEHDPLKRGLMMLDDDMRNEPTIL